MSLVRAAVALDPTAATCGGRGTIEVRGRCPSPLQEFVAECVRRHWAGSERATFISTAPLGLGSFVLWEDNVTQVYDETTMALPARPKGGALASQASTLRAV
jgi:hypothetical protein